MKKIFLLLLPVCFMMSCAKEDEGNALDRDKFLGNYDFVLICKVTFVPGASTFDTSSHIIFIEAPTAGQNLGDDVIIIRNLLDNNDPVEAKVSQNDLILDDDFLTGTGTLSGTELLMDFNYPYNQCQGTASRR